MNTQVKLVKKEDRYDLYDKSTGQKIASNAMKGNGQKLSLKNCQAIENGYDLMKLAEENSHKYYDVKTTDWHCNYNGFFSGFQKALEILGDKKFSEEDVISMIEKSRETGLTAEYLVLTKQQTEWDVEIEMICPHPSDTYRCGMEYGCDADGCNHPNKVPYLDSDGCLILKRK